MYQSLLTRLLLATLLAAAACGDDSNANNDFPPIEVPDVTVSDAGSDATDATDTGEDVGDASDTSDADEDASDADDAGDTADSSDGGDQQVPLSGFGSISGECGVLDDELTSADPHYVENRIDFGDDPYDDSDESLLTDGGREMLADGNAGGSSLLSEVFAYEVLERCELATFLKSENEVVYTTSDTSITDLLVEIDTLKIGVSVTRAVGWPREDPYTVAQAKDLLEGKLLDIQDSSANVAPEDAWQKQILHVIAYEPEHADAIETAFGELDASVKADTVVVVTISDGDDEFLY